MGVVSRSGSGAGLWLAFGVDLLLGEPPEKWHPVCWMGKAVEWAEGVVIGTEGVAATAGEGGGVPERDGNGFAGRAAGILVAVVLPVGTYVATRAALRLAPVSLRGAAEVALLSTALAGRSLYDAAMEVELALALDIGEGRLAVSRMVGRDTGGLDEAGVVRAAVESVAENANDGVVAPLFYALVGGAPLALAYKMINTLDSMIGYRNMRYKDFGWAAARLDDAAGYLPARMTVLAAAAVSLFTGGDAGTALKVPFSEGLGHDSPNAGICEGAFAGSLGVKLGGPDSYKGARVEKPVLGAGFRQPEREDLARAAILMYAAAGTALAAGTLVFRMIKWLGRR